MFQRGANVYYCSSLCRRPCFCRRQLSVLIGINLKRKVTIALLTTILTKKLTLTLTLILTFVALCCFLDLIAYSEFCHSDLSSSLDFSKSSTCFVRQVACRILPEIIRVTIDNRSLGIQFTINHKKKTQKSNFSHPCWKSSATPLLC